MSNPEVIEAASDMAKLLCMTRASPDPKLASQSCWRFAFGANDPADLMIPASDPAKEDSETTQAAVGPAACGECRRPSRSATTRVAAETERRIFPESGSRPDRPPRTKYSAACGCSPSRCQPRDRSVDDMFGIP